jgi:hypothetical protein
MPPHLHQEVRFAGIAPSLSKLLSFNFSTSSAQPTVIEKTELQFDIRAMFVIEHISRSRDWNPLFPFAMQQPICTYNTSLVIIGTQ